MCPICTAKAAKISKMARYFGEKSAEAVLGYFARRMSDEASRLDQLAEFFSAKCRCGDDFDQVIAAIMPDGRRRILPSVALN